MSDDDRTTPPDSIRLTNESVKTLAHPLRSRLLAALRKDGPATATQLATTLHTNTGATSYHLRKLEAVGLVADTGEGTGKRRLWRAATQSHSWTNTQFDDDEDAATAAGWLIRHYHRIFDEQYNHWLDVESGWSQEWRDALGAEDSWVRATPEQVRAMDAEIRDVVARYHDAGGDDPRARRVALWRHAFPLDPDAAHPAAQQPAAGPSTTEPPAAEHPAAGPDGSGERPPEPDAHPADPGATS